MAYGKQTDQFYSHGISYGIEASGSFNFILIKPKSNFKYSDLEGLGTCFNVNIGVISIAILGNSKVDYPVNSVFETYKGIRIGIGGGFGFSFSPATTTKFYNWYPDISRSNILFRH
jgi:hypothetical protein